jgi:hypothetical protein
LRRYLISVIAWVAISGSTMLIGTPRALGAATPDPVLFPNISDVRTMTMTTHRIYVAADTGIGTSTPDSVLEFDFDGDLHATIGPIDGAYGLAIKGSTLYVTAGDVGEIWRYDLAVDPPTKLGSTDLPGDSWARRLVISKNRVWFDADCSQAEVAWIGSIALDGTDLRREINTEEEPQTSPWITCARLDGSAETDRLFVSAENTSARVLDVWNIGVDPYTHLTDEDSGEWATGGFLGGDILPLTGGASFLAGGSDSEAGIDLRNTTDQSLIKHYETEQGSPTAIAHTAENGGLIAAGYGGWPAQAEVIVWSLDDATASTSFSVAGLAEGGLVFSTDGTELIAVGGDYFGLKFYVLDPFAVGSTLSAEATPANARVGDTISVDGVLTLEGDTDPSSRTLTVSRKQGASVVALGDTVTGLGGAYHFEDVPPAGNHRYIVSFAGGDHIDPASAEDTVRVEKRRTRVTIRVSDALVEIGQAVTVTGHLGAGTESDVLELYARTTDGRKRLLRSRRVDENRNLKLTLKPAETLAFIARYDGDDSHEAAEDIAVTKVRVKLIAKLRNFTSTSGAYKIYPGGGTATVVVGVTPNHSGDYVRFTMEVHRSGSWRIVDTASFRLNRDSVVAVYARGPSGNKFRIQAVLPSHADHMGDTSPWLYFRFSG